MSELWTVGAIGAAASSTAALGAWVWIHFQQFRYRPGGTSGHAPAFCAARYEPMARLLDPREIAAIRGRGCNSPVTASSWYRARRRIFRLYLRDLAQDFGRLHAAARALVAESPEECSPLVGLLFRQQIAFWRGMAAIECRLAMNALGIGQVDAGRLIAALESIRLEMESFRPASA